MNKPGTDPNGPLNKEQRWAGGRAVRPTSDSRAEPNARGLFRHLRTFPILLSATLALWWGTPVVAVPAYPGGVEVKQPDGTTFRLHLRGDEFFSWHETAEGHAVVKDPADGFWKFARPAANRAAFRAIPEARVGSVDPVRYGVGRHALPDTKVLRAHIRERQRGVMGEPVEMPVPGAAPGGTPTPQPVEPPPSRIPVSGTKTIKNIVLLACFSDHWNAGADTVLSTQGRVNVSEYQNLFNEVNHTADGAVGSVRDYYNEVSYGKLTVQSVISVWVKLPQNEAYYGANSSGSDVNPQQMVLDAINAAATAGFDFSQGDSDGDGWVDSLTVIHSGHGEEYSGNPSTCIWSHKWNMTSVVTKNGVKMFRYHTEPALRGWTTDAPAITRIGVVCHEMGHFFGLPDLYDYSNTTLGLGWWSIMAGGSWNGDYGTRPAHFDAWSKCFLGFTNPVPIHSQAGLSLARVEDNAVVKLMRDGASNGEYFLVENRAKTGFDNDSAIYPGILIYHVDSQSENNDLSTWAHPVVKIEEADGDNSLGGKTAYSEAGDVWTSTSGLSGGFRDQTGNQSANAMMYQAAAYNRSDNSTYYSYNRLNNFSAAGSSMTCDASTLKTVVNSQTSPCGGYTVSWAASSQATKYEIQEGSHAILTSFSDGAEDEDAMYENWYMSGTVQRDTGGKRSGSYSYAMHQVYGGKWYSSVQSLTMRKPFKVNTGTVISLYLMSHLSSGYGDLKCQISNDSGNTWKTLGAYNGYIDPWSLRSYNYTALNAQGINAGDVCILRFVANFEAAWGWSAFPGYGFVLDDISITGTEIAGYGGWTTLNNNVTATSYRITGKPTGVYAYRVRAYANATWQGYGSGGETTVQDTQAPTISCPANLADVPTDAGQCYATGVALGTPTTGDNCGVASVSNDAPAQFPKGTTTVTWTVTDTSGNTATCQQTVTVKDHQAPTIACPANLTDVATDAGKCYATGVALGTPTTGDNCGVASVSNDAPTQFPKGTTTVTWTVTDTSGNTATCSFSVTVQDTQAPTIACPANLTDVPSDAGKCYATGVALGAPTTGDNCGLASVSNDAPSQFPKGTTTVTWTVTDTSGNSATCQQTVMVKDHEVPMIGAVTATETQPYVAGPVDVLNCSSTTVQGTVHITVVAADNCGGTVTVSLANGTTEAATFVSGDGTPGNPFTFTWAVTETTAGGTWAGTVTATDTSGNSSTGTFTLCANAAQVTGQVELEGFVGTARTVTFIATANVDIGGVLTTNVLKTWNLAVQGFSEGQAGYSLTDFPPEAQFLSAKTAWSLRKKLSVTFDANHQGTAIFTGTSRLLGGDLDGDNVVGIPDFAIYRAQWGTAGPGADVNGDGAVGIPDFNLFRANWGTRGDPQ